MGTQTKCIKIEVIPDKEWKDKDGNILQKVLWDMQYDTYRALNDCMTYQYSHDKEKSILKDSGIVPTDDKEYFGKTLRAHLYDICNKRMSKNGALVVGQTATKSLNQYGTDKKKGLLKGEVSLSSFKRNCPIQFHNNGVKFYKDNNGERFLKLSLFSNEYKKENGVSGQADFSLTKLDGSRKAIIDRIISGEYKGGSAELSYNKEKKKWFLSTSFTFETNKTSDVKNVLGVDLGIHNAVALAVYNTESEDFERIPYKESLIAGGAVEEVRNQMWKRRADIGMQTKLNTGGHGYKQKCKKLLKLSDHEKNFRDTYNYKMSKYIIDTAIKHRCGKIQLEALDSNFATTKFLKNWAFYDLIQKIKTKAGYVGIEVVEIDPAYTSKRCSYCGNINLEIKGTKDRDWVCPSCGKKHNRDLNAAKNISMPNIEGIIKHQKEVQDIK